MDWNGRKILVTGGAGFLGSNLCHGLLARGARVTALDGFLYGGGANPANLEELPDQGAFELVRADIREIDLRPLCEGAEVIFNLAAQTSHLGGQRDPLADIAVNAVAQVRLIQAAREAAPDAVVVHASTLGYFVAGCLQGQRRALQSGVVSDREAPIAVQIRIGTCLQVTLEHGAQAGYFLRGGRMRAQPAILEPFLITHLRHPGEMSWARP